MQNSEAALAPTSSTLFRPLIGLPADTQADDEMPYHSAGDAYLRAVAGAAHAHPVIIPAIADALDLDDLLDRFDGIVLTGAVSNVHPPLYGMDETPAHEPYDRRRDDLTLDLIRKTVARGMPLLCICRGHQELNVALGGSLEAQIQRVSGRLDHRMPRTDDIDARYAPSHTIALAPGGLLEGILGKSETRVNSLHRQAIDRLGAGVQVEARAPDGIIEAVSLVSARGFVLGVQWHPEWDVARNADSLNIFQAFGKAARAWAARKI